MNSIVLVISRQPELRRLIRKTIQATSDVFDFDSAEGALRIFPTIAQRSKLIFLDLNTVPGENASTILQQFRNIHPFVALVPIVREESELQFVAQMKAIGIYEVLRPPFKPGIISLVAHRVLIADEMKELFQWRELLTNGYSAEVA